MKYLEEISTGECFVIGNEYFITTSDFKKDGKKLCINLRTGNGRWLSPEEIIDPIDLFTFDKDSNILAIKERKKDNENA